MCYTGAMFRVEMLTVGVFQSNCFIVWCDETSDALVFDAGDESERIVGKVRELGVNVKAVINTHAHLDHISGLPGVVEALGVPVFMHRDEMPIYDSVADQAAMFGLPAPRQVAIHRFLEDGDVVNVGKLRGEVALAPGHSPGSICIAFADGDDQHLIAGDVLFRGSIGRTDLPGGDWETMVETLARRILPLPDGMVVYPGHGPHTTIGEEKQSNPFLAPLAQRRDLS